MEGARFVAAGVFAFKMKLATQVSRKDSILSNGDPEVHDNLPEPPVGHTPLLPTFLVHLLSTSNSYSPTTA